MKLVLFPDLRGESYSMHLYCRELARHFSEGLRPTIFQPSEMSLPAALGKPLNKWLLYLMQAKRKQGEVNHIIDHGYSHLLLSLDKDRTVVTCHDLHPLELPSIVSWKTRKLFKKKMELMLQAKKIIAISEHTKQDILKHFPQADESKIAVVYNGVAKEFKKLPKEKVAAAKKKFGFAGKQVLLHVGLSQEYKNVASLLQALALIEDKNIVLAKIGGILKSEEELIRKLGLSNRIVSFPFVSERELVELYNAADLFVFPSLHEGFGFPVLEAMKCGCPVICANVASLPEVAGKAALYVEPRNVSELADSIATVLASDSMRRKMSKEGLTQAEKFSWEKCAQQTEAVYQEVCR